MNTSWSSKLHAYAIANPGLRNAEILRGAGYTKDSSHGDCLLHTLKDRGELRCIDGRWYPPAEKFGKAKPRTPSSFMPLQMARVAWHRPAYDAPGCVVRSIDGVLA